MKIAIVSSYFLPHKGGVEFVVYNQAKQLASKGHKVTILTSKIGEEPDEETMEGFRIKRVKIINFFEKKLGVPYPLYSMKLIGSFSKEIKNSDLVYIQDLFYMPCFFGALLANIHKKPIVLMEHIKFEKNSKKIVNFFQKFVINTCGKYILNSAEKVIVCNVKVKKWLGLPEKTVFIKNAVNTKMFRPVSESEKINLRKKYNLPVNKPIILFVGRLVEAKGFDKLFSARDRAYLTLFVGDGNATEEMKNSKEIKLIGSVNQKKLVEFYQMADIFCLPSRNEGFPLSILEALSCGIPVISSNLEGYNEYLNKDDAILIKSTPENIKKSILYLLRSKNLRNNLRKKSRIKAVEEFSWETNVQNLMKIFLSLTNNETTKSKQAKKEKF
jgi:D-inositol-3-phosphate glycosyltransferase